MSKDFIQEARQQILDAITSGKLQPANIILGDNVKTKVEAGGVVNNNYYQSSERDEVISEPPASELQHDSNVRIFKYIHPSIIKDEEQRIISQTVGNLVSRFDMRTICEQLKKMEKENKLLLPKMPDPILEELHHMGLPDESVSGYSKSNFVKYI